MITIEINELNHNKGFIVNYFDVNQPTDLDEDLAYFETFDDAIKFLSNQVKKTMESRK
jgi:hypothetical protein